MDECGLKEDQRLVHAVGGLCHTAIVLWENSCRTVSSFPSPVPKHLPPPVVSWVSLFFPLGTSQIVASSLLENITPIPGLQLWL